MATPARYCSAQVRFWRKGYQLPIHVTVLAAAHLHGGHQVAPGPGPEPQPRLVVLVSLPQPGPERHRLHQLPVPALHQQRRLAPPEVGLLEIRASNKG